MNKIEVPDWVVEIALKGRAEVANQPPKIVDGYYHFPTTHDAMRAAITAALLAMMEGHSPDAGKMGEDAHG